MTDSRPSWIGRTIGNRYQIEELLGRGGMSSVYRAIDPNLQRNVAVKIIHPHLSEHPEFVKRFVQEAAAVAQLRHPHIIQVHDFSDDDGTYYMILEHVPGETLEKRLTSLKSAKLRLPLSETIHILANLCDAVAYAHDRNMIHRDLKPSNVIINLLGEPILMDFGIAKIVGGDHVHTATGATIGTAAYMAPEQVLGESVDHRADIYSLGVMLFEMASGRVLYDGKSALTVMMKHVKEPIPDIRVFNSNVPDVLVGILEKALAKNPEDRFSSPIEMGTALRMVGQQTLESTTFPLVYTEPDTAVPEQNIPPASKPAKPPVQTTTEKSAKTKAPIDRRLIAGIAAILVVALSVGGFLLWPRLFRSTPTSAGMVQIPAGTYFVGLGNGGSQYAPEQQIDLLTYWIDDREVTNIEYAAFLSDKNIDPPSGWVGGSLPAGQEQYPVQGIGWEAAQAYCEWAGKRLPTEAEWEIAARGPDGLLYPWGDEAELVKLATSETYAAGTIPVNRSIYNIYDMAGNVWEWVDEPYTAVPAGQQVLRGGAYDNQRDLAYRLVGDPEVPTMRVTAGFRCAAAEVEIVPDASILFRDDFVDPQSGWQTVDDGTVLFGYHQPDFYHVQASQPETISTSLFGGNFDDITVETAVFVESAFTENGNFRYGLLLRRNGDDYYAFTISPRSGNWYAFKHTADSLEMLGQGTIDSLNGLTASDILRVDAHGAQFAFSINGRLVIQLTDSDFSSGDIGFLVETFDEVQAHIHYDALTIRQVAYAPSGTVLLQDDFTDPTSGWPTINDGSTVSGYHPPDYYHVQASESAHRSLAFNDRQFDDFTMEAEIFVDSTDTPEGDFRYGLAVRHQDNAFYAFLISPQSGDWRVIKNSINGEELLAAGNDSSLSGLETVNQLRLDASGNDMVFQANGRPLVRVQDDTLRQGEIGFIVESVDQSRVHIHYDDVVVRQADIDLAAAPLADQLASVATPEPTTVLDESVTESIDPLDEPTPVPEPETAIPSSENMVLIDGGTYEIGDNTAVALESYWIDQYEVTNAQFAAYLTDTGQTSSEAIGADDHPVDGVSWETAVAYCQWSNKRLPTEAEWTAAARGPHAWLYPWGNEKVSVTLPESGTYIVGSIPTNRSYFGAFDMAGNVWEWVGETFLPTVEGQRVLRGGANGFQQDLTERLPGNPNSSVMTTDAGFRCAASRVEADQDVTHRIHDDFVDLESGWWQARAPEDAYFYGYHPSDFYHVQVSDANDCLSVNHDQILDNFMAEIQVFTASTDTETGEYRYGMTVRQTDKSFYALLISPRQQTWQIFKSKPDGLGLMAEGSHSFIRGDAQETRDRLFVVANGPEMIFFVNGALISRIVDAEYASGSIGFIVDTIDETYAHIHYDTVDVWDLPASVTVPEVDEETAVLPITDPICRGSVVAGNTLVNFISHTVTAGESLISITQQYGVTEEAIMGANGKSLLDPNLIRPGQILVIPQS